jgi:excisionase family DNA binding protein
MAKEQGQWLTLSQAAQLIGVHPSTVRLWSDKGRIPVHRTQGRHRRYLRAEVELWIQAARQTHVLEPESLVQQALRQMRFQIGESHLEAEGWYQRLDEEARDEYRQSGRHLIQGLASYLASEGKGASAEAGALGYEYASLGRRYGLDSIEAVRAFLFFRNTLLESMIAVYEKARVPSGAAWGEMLTRVFAFTDQILVSLLETYRVLEKKLS